MDIFSTAGNIILIIIGFGLLITVHEFGHFIAARWAGIRVEGFAIGMGPPVITYRSGIGLRWGSSDEIVKSRTGKNPSQLTAEEQKSFGIGETEYSLRLLFLGGYVKMLGQEDGNPNAVSDDPRSYTSTPIGKRMVVVSAGVVMNLLTAILFFMIAFLVGVPFEAPVVGTISPGSPAMMAQSVSTDSDGSEATSSMTGLKSGDEIISIDGNPVSTFSDVMVASAMSVPDKKIMVQVQRENVEKPITFAIEPQQDETMGIRQMGIAPAITTTLRSFADQPLAEAQLEEAFTRAGAEASDARTLAGWRITTVNGNSVSEWAEVTTALSRNPGATATLIWAPPAGNTDSPRTISVTARPDYENLYYEANDINGLTQGLLGLAPLVALETIPSDSPNADILEAGDIVLSIASIQGPRMGEFRSTIGQYAGKELSMSVLRNGSIKTLTTNVSREGQIGVLPNFATRLPLTAQPLTRTASTIDGPFEPTPISKLQLLPRTRINRIGETPISDWPSIREALLNATADSLTSDTPSEVSISWTLPLADAQEETGVIEISPKEARSLHALGYSLPMQSFYFEPMQVRLSANGNPFTAIKLGFAETWKIMVLTYTTIDRVLFTQSVSPKQLHGPVGIVHIGTRVADRGYTYLIFFLAMISVNLAVLNFLPIPIVDGGLFLFLVYEKIMKRPPSIAFQNGATLIGLAMIGTLFIYTFYNDIGRLIG